MTGTTMTLVLILSVNETQLQYKQSVSTARRRIDLMDAGFEKTIRNTSL